MMVNYAQWLKDVGRGGLNSPSGFVDLPEYIPTLTATQGMESLINKVFPHVKNLNLEGQCTYFQKRAILAAKNDCVDDANKVVLDMLNGLEYALQR
jgi:hypothetical protein